MRPSGSLTQQLNMLPSPVRKLIVGEDEQVVRVSTVKIADIGDNVINFMALIVGNLFIDNHRTAEWPDNLRALVEELLLEDRGVHEGTCISIHRALSKTSNIDDSILSFSQDEQLLSRWIEARKRVLKAKRGKAVLTMRCSISRLLEDLLSRAACLFELQSADDKVWVLNKRNLRVPIFPFFINKRDPESGKVNLYAYDRYSSQSNDYNYVSWGMNRTIAFDDKKAPQFQKLSRLAATFRNQQDEEKSSTSYMPLFAGSFPAMQRLINLLWDETEYETKQSLWPWSNDLGRHCLVKSEKEKNLRENEEAIKNQILFDCIERSPLTVLLDVGRKEGICELPGYVSTLSEEDEIEDRLTSLEERWVTLADKRGLKKDDDRDALRNQVYSIEVARLLGFPVHDMSAYTNIEYYMNILTKEIKNTTGRFEGGYGESLVRRTLLNLEQIYREMIIFYEYIYARYIQRSFNESAWEETRQGVRKLTLGSLHNRFRTLNNKFEKSGMLTNRIWGANGICNFRTYGKIIKEGHPGGDMIGWRNTFSHSGETLEIVGELSSKECIEVLQWILKAMNFLADCHFRIFPYKLTFTVFSHTHQGIRTCHYVTDLSDLAAPVNENSCKVGDTKIYTDTDIDFTKVYYCLPHRRRSLGSVWVNPLLIPMDEVKN